MPAKITDVKAWFGTRYTALPNGCWLWRGATYSNGYGNTKVPGTKKFSTAHKLSYRIHIGEYDESLDLDHLCRNRACVNPSHLEPVTRSVNLRRGIGRQPLPFCGKGHPMAGENLYIYPAGKHGCRICIRSYRKRKTA